MIRHTVFAVAAFLSLSSAARAEELTITQWSVGFYGVPIAVAMDKGYFKEAGIDVTGVLTAPGGGTAVRNMLASPLPYGEVALSAALAARAQGLPVVLVNVGSRSIAEFAWVTKPDSDVRTIKDLVGKKVAFTSPKSVTEMLLLMSLDAAGVKQDSVTRVAGGGYGPGITLMEAGGVAAAPIIEPALTINKTRYRTVFAAKDLLPPMVITVGITTAEFAASNPGKLTAIVGARRKGVDFAYASPHEAAQIVTKTFENLDPKVADEAVGKLQDAKLWSRGEFVKDELDRMANAEAGRRAARTGRLAGADQRRNSCPPICAACAEGPMIRCRVIEITNGKAGTRGDYEFVQLPTPGDRMTIGNTRGDLEMLRVVRNICRPTSRRAVREAGCHGLRLCRMGRAMERRRLTGRT